MSHSKDISENLYLISFKDEIKMLGERNVENLRNDKMNGHISFFNDKSGNVYSGHTSKTDKKYHLTNLIKSSCATDENNNSYLNASDKGIVDANNNNINPSESDVPLTDNNKSSNPKCLSDNQMQEVKDCSLKYINLIFDKKYTNFDRFYYDSFLRAGIDQRMKFVVAFVLMLSASEKHKNKSVSEVMRLEMGIENFRDNVHDEIVSLIENERNRLLQDECEESIYDYYDEYIENIQNSVKYF